MENLKAFNLELALFLKTLYSFTTKVNEIDDETTQLLVETILAVNKLQNGSIYRETSFFNENRFLDDLNEEQFICRRHIVCRLCHIDFPLSAEEFKIHVEKKSHKGEVAKLKSTQANSNGNATIQAAACDSKIVVKDRFNSNLTIESRPSSTSSSIGSSNLSVDCALITNVEKKSYAGEVTKVKITQVNSNSNETIHSNAFDSKNLTNGCANSNVESRSSSASNSIDGTLISKDYISPIKNDNVPKKTNSNPVLAEVIDFTTRTDMRIRSERHIIDVLSRYLQTIDCSTILTAFGSSTYGFGGSKTNFNVMVKAGPEKNPLSLMAKVEKSFKTTEFPSEFEVLGIISGSRAQKSRYQLLHKKSQILCWLHFDRDFEATESSQIIRNCINHSPLCYHLIACVNSLCAQGAPENEHFNTYTISMLVLFFLQVNHNFPKLIDVPSSQLKTIDAVPKIDKNVLKKAVKEFFCFYGERWQVGTHLISLSIGRWQERELDSQQTKFSPQQKSLRDAMKLNPVNWDNFSMYVQDIKSPGINVTSEIPREEALNFKVICNVLASSEFEEMLSQLIDEYVSRIQFIESSVNFNSSNLSLNSTSSSNANPSHKTSVFSMQNIKTEIGDIENVLKQISPIPSTSKNVESVIKMEEVTKSVNANVNPSDHSTKNDCIHADDSTKSASDRITSLQLENLVEADCVSRAIANEMTNLTTQTEDRLQSEAQILKSLACHLKKLDSTLSLISFGSSTYGFGGTNTNLNILINAGQSESNPMLLQHKFHKLMRNSPTQNEFETLDRRIGDRAQRQRLQLLHKQSRIMCWLQFGQDFSLSKSSEIIRDYIQYAPICYHLTAYIRAWQHVISDASNDGTRTFHFNSYVIFVLVIFFLQMNYKFPKLNDLRASKDAVTDTASSINKEHFKQVVAEFFDFYATKYETNSHIISLFIGQWQNRWSPEDESLKSTIESNVINWKNCSMFVQDIVSPNINITAEISKEEANSFKTTIKQFSTERLYKRILNESISKISQFQVPKHFQTFDNLNTNTKTITKESPIPKRNAEILNLIEKELDNISSFSESRQCIETDIISKITKYIHSFDASLGIVKIGSSQYGIKRPKTNVNLLVNTHGNKPKILIHYFLSQLDKTDIRKHFKLLNHFGANRVLRKQINMNHINSGLECTLLFDKDNTIAESTEIVKCYIDKEPKCRFLITFIKFWQEILNDSNIDNFNFNTYIISVLVIFFLQVTHKIPLVKDIFSVQPNTATTAENFKQIPRQFFDFYGNRYQIWNHVISAHIGQWQERRLQPEQTHLEEAKQRLRNGIEKSPENWTNCTMYVQDLVRFDVNITAEIPKAAAEQFQLICQKCSK